MLCSLDDHSGERFSLSGGLVPARAPEINRDEWRLVRSAGKKRQREFACGRRLAHQALEQLGYPTAFIDQDEKGCPIWPTDVVGSISHTDKYCIAAVAREKSCSSLGIDLEEILRMKKSLWPRLFTEVEIGILREHVDPFEQSRHAAIIFSTKEALYKCDFPLNRRWLDFKDVQVVVGDRPGHLLIEVMNDEKIMKYEGCYVAGMTHVATVVYQIV